MPIDEKHRQLRVENSLSSPGFGTSFVQTCPDQSWLEQNRDLSGHGQLFLEYLPAVCVSPALLVAANYAGCSYEQRIMSLPRQRWSLDNEYDISPFTSLGKPESRVAKYRGTSMLL